MRLPSQLQLLTCVVLSWGLWSCSRDVGEARAEAPPSHTSTVVGAGSVPASAGPRPSGTAPEKTTGKSPAPAPSARPVDLEGFPWLADSKLRARVADDLEQRFAPPPGFTRVELGAGSFGAWLRRLPLEPPGTPVRSYAGGIIQPASSPSVAAVVALDVGDADLQQCADAVMRLHGEWRWSQGARDQSYRAASGLKLEFQRWARGERLVAKGASLSWVPRGRAGADHGSFRQFMDAVFAWTNTVALARQAEPSSYSALRPGDFVVQGGNPGHSVLILDVARAADGRQQVLLGQSYMPAQSFHVLKRAGSAWFAIAPDQALQTPFWPKPFTWTQLRRLDK